MMKRAVTRYWINFNFFFFKEEIWSVKSGWDYNGAGLSWCHTVWSDFSRVVLLEGQWRSRGRDFLFGLRREFFKV